MTRWCEYVLPELIGSLGDWQVMSGRDWCSLDQWLACRRPLCPVAVRHDDLASASLASASASPAPLQVCFASRRLGGRVLEDGATQVSFYSIFSLYDITRPFVIIDSNDSDVPCNIIIPSFLLSDIFRS